MTVNVKRREAKFRASRRRRRLAIGAVLIVTLSATVTVGFWLASPVGFESSGDLLISTNGQRPLPMVFTTSDLEDRLTTPAAIKGFKSDWRSDGAFLKKDIDASNIRSAIRWGSNGLSRMPDKSYYTVRFRAHDDQSAVNCLHKVDEILHESINASCTAEDRQNAHAAERAYLQPSIDQQIEWAAEKEAAGEFGLALNATRKIIESLQNEQTASESLLDPATPLYRVVWGSRPSKAYEAGYGPRGMTPTLAWLSLLAILLAGTATTWLIVQRGTTTKSLNVRKHRDRMN